MTTNLPFELVEEILSRLPVKSLKRFRCVAKSWCSLIDSKNFTKLHLISNFHRRLILGGSAVYSIDLDSPEKAYDIEPRFYCHSAADRISNSVNGLVLVIEDSPILWNPFSGEHIVLPKNSLTEPQPDPYYEYYCTTTYGFGYDSINDDYKIVRVFEHRFRDTQILTYAETHIYSLESDDWKKIEIFPYLPFMRPFHVNGVLHNLMVKSDNAKIIGFSVESEKYHEMIIPKELQILGLLFYAEFCVESLVSLNPSVEFKNRVPVKNNIMNKRDDFLSKEFKVKL